MALGRARKRGHEGWTADNTLRRHPDEQIERGLVVAAKAISFRAEDRKIDIFGSAAVATLVLDWSATMPDGETYAARSRVTLVLVDDRGACKIAHEHFSAFPGAA